MYHIAPTDEKSKTELPCYVFTAGHDHVQELRDRPRGCDFHHVFVVEQGTGIFETEGERLILNPGTAIFLPKNLSIRYYGTDETLRTGWVTFNGTGVDGILNYFNPAPLMQCPADRLEPKPEEFCRMIQRQESPERLSAELYRLLVSFFSAKESGKPRLETAKAFIEENYRRDLSVEEIASAAGVSESLLYRLFRDNGTTPVEYLRVIRIKKAKKELLEAPSASIRQVAEDCGFSDFSYFCKIFRNQTGLTPGGFRKRYAP